VLRLKLEEWNLKILRLLKNEWKDGKVIALDLETSVMDPNNFLTDELILAVSFAWRSLGEPLEEKGISVKTIILDAENEESEKELLIKLNEELEELSRSRSKPHGVVGYPLAVVGYNIRQYDIPLLVFKKEKYQKRYNLSLWEIGKIVDVTELAAIIDLYHILKYILKYMRYKNLEEALSAQEFKHLQLRRTRHLVPTNREEKGKEIYRLWKESKETLKEYLEGEVYDFLLIAEYLVFGGGHRER
jgi:DNA polymerase elongation subunit (family B)